jgi:peroxiredoxin
VKKLENGIHAPDFEMRDTNGNSVKLSDFRGKKRVVLVLMRGFV